MLQNKRFYCQQLPWLLVVGILIICAGCKTTGLTPQQKEVLEDNLHFVADAIKFSATKIQRPLTEYYDSHGAWPVSVAEQQEVLGSIDRILDEHGVASARLLAIDQHDILVDYKFSRQYSLRFPSLLESWTVVFSNKNEKQLEVLAVYPTWRDPEKLAQELSYNVELVKEMQSVFRQQLQVKLSSYSLTLNESLNESI
ncbi:hypothetical protein [Kaarinaea lacus]